MGVTRIRCWHGLALVAVLSMLLAACGGQNGQEEPAAADDGAATAEAENGGTEPPERITVPVVQSVDSLTFLPVYAAQTQGFYDEAGIDLEITLGGVGGREVQAPLGGEVGIAFSAGTELVKVAAQGRDVIAVQGMGAASVSGR